MYNNKSILEMCNGAFLERASYEMAHIVDNIMDVNTDPKQKRVLTMTITFQADSERKNISANFVAKCKLAPTNPVGTNLYVSGDITNGELQITELTPQIPGQMNFDGSEQEEANILDLANFR